MWNIYDDLINGIPEEYIAEEIAVGFKQAYVKSGNSLGVAPAIDEQTRQPMFSDCLKGKTLKEVAKCVKSWNFVEAAIGNAAINAYYNSVEQAETNGIKLSKSKYSEDRMSSPFIAYQNNIKDKNVTVIGHFPYIETLFEPVCNLSIIETDPEEGDYPFYAYEYILPSQDYVFISCSTIIRKTLPRIIELSKNAVKVIVGPSTPLAPKLFEYGIHDLSGFVFKDIPKAINILEGSQYGRVYSTGQKISFQNPK